MTLHAEFSIFHWIKVYSILSVAFLTFDCIIQLNKGRLGLIPSNIRPCNKPAKKIINWTYICFNYYLNCLIHYLEGPYMYNVYCIGNLETQINLEIILLRLVARCRRISRYVLHIINRVLSEDLLRWLSYFFGYCLFIVTVGIFFDQRPPSSNLQRHDNIIRKHVAKFKIQRKSLVISHIQWC